MSSDSEEFYAQSKKDTWRTPESFYGAIADRQGGIDLDPCAAPDSTIGDVNYTIAPDPDHEDIKHQDGLAVPWFGTVFVNPPFSYKGDWLEKAVAEYDAGHTDLIVVVVPDSTDTKSWWHEYIAGVADYVWFRRGRLAYVDEDGERAGSPTFGTALAIYGEPTDALLDWLSQEGHLVQTVKEI